jgi:carbon monoxide dehydrogenase subunit G
MRIERKIDIESSPESIFNIVMDANIISRWNPAVDDAEVSADSILLKTNLGSLNVINTESKENESLAIKIEGGNISSIGYNLTPKKDKTEVMLWSEFTDKKYTKTYKNVGDLVLRGLKRYSEFIEGGGTPEDFEKN